MAFSNLTHLVKSDFPKLAKVIHDGDWYLHQIIEEPNHDDWCYECLLGPATSPAAILQFLPHGGNPQVQYFITEGGTFDELELSDAQIKAGQAFIDSIDPGQPRLAEEEQANANAPKPAASESKGGCFPLLLLPLVVGSALLAKCLGLQ